MRTEPYYIDPERYEVEYAGFIADRDWYSRRALAHGGPVLELGVGTGRMMFALAALGLEVDGLDSSPEMLAFARRRARERALAVRLVEADFRSFELGRCYRTILAPVNALMHLLTDEDLGRALDQVVRHLAPGGQFLFDLTLPRAELLADTAVPGGSPLRTLRLRGRTYLERELHRYDPESRISRTCHIFEAEDGGESFASELALRLLSPDEVKRHLDRAGLQALACFGDYREQPIDPAESVMQLYVTAAAP